MALHYIDYLLILASAVSGSVSVSAFVSSFAIPINISSSAVGLKISAITAGIKKYESIIEKRKKKRGKIV